MCGWGYLASRACGGHCTGAEAGLTILCMPSLRLHGWCSASMRHLTMSRLSSPSEDMDGGITPGTPLSHDVDVDIGLDLSPFHGIEYLAEDRAVTGWVLQGLKSQVRPITVSRDYRNTLQHNYDGRGRDETHLLVISPPRVCP